jgi:hypothetical protein
MRVMVSFRLDVDVLMNFADRMIEWRKYQQGLRKIDGRSQELVQRIAQVNGCGHGQFIASTM